MVTKVSTFLTITNCFKKFNLLIFSNCKYLHVKIASLTTVKSCIVGPDN